MPCLALPCLALPRMCIYIIIIYILFGAEVVCASCSFCIVSLPEGRMFSVAPSPIDIVWWKIRTRVKTTVPRSEIFRVFCRLQMIFNPGSLQNYFGNISLCFPMFFSSQSCSEAWLLCTSDCSKASWTTWTWGLRNLVLPTWCLWTWDCIAIDLENSWLSWFSFAATNVLNESARTLFLLTVSAVSGTV